MLKWRHSLSLLDKKEVSRGDTLTDYISITHTYFWKEANKKIVWYFFQVLNNGCCLSVWCDTIQKHRGCARFSLLKWFYVENNRLLDWLKIGANKNHFSITFNFVFMLPTWESPGKNVKFLEILIFKQFFARNIFNLLFSHKRLAKQTLIPFNPVKIANHHIIIETCPTFKFDMKIRNTDIFINISLFHYHSCLYYDNFQIFQRNICIYVACTTVRAWIIDFIWKSLNKNV